MIKDPKKMALENLMNRDLEEEETEIPLPEFDENPGTKIEIEIEPGYNQEEEMEEESPIRKALMAKMGG